MWEHTCYEHLRENYEIKRKDFDHNSKEKKKYKNKEKYRERVDRSIKSSWKQ